MPTPKLSECELYLDHTPVWAGDGFFCSKCMLQFESITPKPTPPAKSAEKKCPKHGVTHRNGGYPSCPELLHLSAEKKTEENWEERFDATFRVCANENVVQITNALDLKNFIRQEITAAEARGKKMPIDKKEWEAAYRADVEEEGRNARRQKVLEIRNIVENLDVSGGGSGRRIRLQLLAYLEAEGNKEINK